MVRALLQFGQVVRMDESSFEDEAVKICLRSSLAEQLTDQRIVGRKNRAEMPVEPSIKQNKLLTQVVITANRECRVWVFTLGAAQSQAGNSKSAASTKTEPRVSHAPGHGLRLSASISSDAA